MHVIRLPVLCVPFIFSGGPNVAVESWLHIRASDIAHGHGKYCEKKNTVKFGRSLIKYMSVQHI